MIDRPVIPEIGDERLTEAVAVGQHPGFSALSIADGDGAVFFIEVAQPDVTDLAAAQPEAKKQLQYETVAKVFGQCEQVADLGGGKQFADLLWFARSGYVDDAVGVAEDFAIEILQRTAEGVEGGLSNRFFPFGEEDEDVIGGDCVGFGVVVFHEVAQRPGVVEYGTRCHARDAQMGLEAVEIRLAIGMVGG